MFKVIPAIDIKNAQCVRLLQGNMNAVTVYDSDPVVVAERWANYGARYLHVVDLDGAVSGKPVHLKIVQRIIQKTKIKIELGGGIRTDSDIEEALTVGVDRVVLGTRAIVSPNTLTNLVKKFGKHIAIAIDAREKEIYIHGWQKSSGIQLLDFARIADDAGVETLIYTSINVDGTMKGPDLQTTAELCKKVSANVIASGGISSVEDILSLKNLNLPNLTGVIIGKALYEGRILPNQICNMF
jgi:phosphoribosylformimino-5-aminoimidazole carboxamide ribotide isomerase